MDGPGLPTDYVDEPALAGYATQQRDDFVGWVAKFGGKSFAELDMGFNDYRSFAVTDDSVFFFFDQDWPMDHVSGPLTVTVPRAALASILA